MQTSAPVFPSPAAPMPSNYNVFKRLGMLALAIVIYVAASLIVVLPDPSAPLTSQRLINTMGYAGIGLLVLLYLQHRKQGLAEVTLGTHLRRPLLYGLVAMVATYALGGVLMYLFEIPRESFMVHFYDGLGPTQIALLSVTLVLFPPVAEELLFRHYLMRVFPLHKGRFWQWTAIVVSTLVFVGLHSQYDNYITLVTLLLVGLILGIARVASGGLLVPVLLHASAEVVAISLNYLQMD
ncbi:membrane protease YdiL (CAAX protease family) [Pseudomonas hunanensis]|uniref:Membrane protease YdiL (CAAX protease family) n=1 Tax=Pseudomonas hunanensis TaxID=1247546 RepID=A0ACC6JYI1_9PSED|nr:type II CAAX endopeptidase family protein [Pseudomonas hunanensis]MDR6711232.1 membrane protease YdiL (CAAX protease family) [Pseudomonas hunanensis]